MSNIKCKICETEFPAAAWRHYVAVETISSNESVNFDAFDCPNCGCQVIVQQRKPPYDFQRQTADNCGGIIYNGRRNINDNDI